MSDCPPPLACSPPVISSPSYFVMCIFYESFDDPPEYSCGPRGDFHWVMLSESD